MNKTNSTIDNITISKNLESSLDKALRTLAEQSDAITINESDWMVEINLAAFNVDYFMYSSHSVDGKIMPPVTATDAESLTRKSYHSPEIIIGCMIADDEGSKQQNAIYTIINNARELAEILEMNYKFVSKSV